MKRCPVCKSSNITLYMGFQFGNYQCKKCGFVGSLILDDKDKKLDEKAKAILKDMKEQKL